MDFLYPLLEMDRSRVCRSVSCSLVNLLIVNTLLTSLFMRCVVHVAHNSLVTFFELENSVSFVKFLELELELEV